MTISISPDTYHLPSVFGYRKHDVSRTRSPAYSMGHRVYSTQTKTSPGPNYYHVPMQTTRFGKHSPSTYRFDRRERFHRMPNANLAPNMYRLDEIVKGFGQTLPKAPTYSIGQRYRRRIRGGPPAPNQYNLQQYLPGTHTPAFSFDRYGIAVAAKRSTN